MNGAALGACYRGAGGAEVPLRENASLGTPLDHYNTFGWHEGRDPSPGFDTTDYLAAYADVAAASVKAMIQTFMNAPCA